MASVPARRGAVAVIVRQSRLLVIRRAEGIAAPGKFCFPGGGIEPHESEAQALVRELQEELGTTVIPARWLWSSTTSWGVELAWWLAEVADSAMFTPNPAEVASVHWMTMAEMDALEDLLESNREFLAFLRATNPITALRE
jgi:8-oxo-dGTP diphosphatase